MNKYRATNTTKTPRISALTSHIHKEANY